MTIYIITIAAILPFVLFLGIKPNYRSFQLLMCLCFLQNIFMVWISPYITYRQYVILVLLKELLVVITVLSNMLRTTILNKVDVWCYVSIIVLVLYLLVNNGGDFMGGIASFRQLYLPFVFYLFGRSMKVTKKQFLECIRLYVYMCVFACFFGFYEQIMGDSFWQALHIKSYTILKYEQAQMYLGYYTILSFYSFDLYSMTGKVIKRMCSFLADPVMLSQLLALGCLFVLFFKGIVRKEQKIIAAILLTGLALTLGKGGILIFTISAAVLIRKNKSLKWLSDILVFLSIIIFLYLLMASSDEVGSSGNMHLRGLTENFVLMLHYPFGKGIGSVGNVAGVFSSTELSESTIGESFIGALMGQMGIIGIIMYGGFGYLLYDNLRKRHINGYVDNFTFIIRISIVSLFITSFVNNTAVSFNSCFPYFIFAGMKFVSDFEFDNSIGDKG